MGFIKSAMGDAVLTSLWVFALPLVGIFTAKISYILGVETILPLTLLITTFVSSSNVIIFSLLGNILGGASFNPSTTVAFYAAGLKPDDSLISMAARFPIQAAGGAAGALAILQVMPSEYKHRLKGPYLRVDLHTGAIAEGVVSFVFCFSLLCVMMKGPNNIILKVWLQSLTTLTLVLTGSGYTGPSINPANAFGWAYVNSWHNSWELFYVYWICPFFGAIVAASVYKLLFSSAAIKQKKA